MNEMKPEIMIKGPLQQRVGSLRRGNKINKLLSSFRAKAWALVPLTS